MILRNLAFSAALALPLVIGCGGGDATPTGDGGVTPMTCDEVAPTYLYVLDTLDVGREDPAGIVPGFDLDGLTSTDADADGCYIADWTSPDGVPGIDNQLADLAPTIELATGTALGQQLQDSIASGSVLILIELENVDDFTNDPCINLNLFLANVPGDVAPQIDPATGMLLPDQAFDIDPASLDAAGNPVVRVEGARIVNGSVLAGPVDLSFNLPAGGMEVPLNVRDAQLAFDVSATGLSNGILGGQLINAELIAAVVALAPDQAGLVESTLANLADLGPDPSDPMALCTGLSVGLTFGATTATRN